MIDISTILVVTFAVAVGVALALTIGLAGPSADLTDHAAADVSSASHGEDVLTWENTITVERNGEVVDTFHNVLTFQGRDFIRDKISALNATGDIVASDADKNVSFIAVGNKSAPSESDTVLPGEVVDGSSGLSRAQGSTTAYQAGNFSVEVTFDATEDVGVVNTTSLNWNSSGPSIVSGGAFGTEANILSGDQLTVTHNISIQ